MSLRRLVAALIVLTLVVAGVFVALSLREKKKPPETSLPSASFTTVEVRAVDPLDRSESAGRATELAAKVTTLLNGYYTAAMLRPGRWVVDENATPSPNSADQVVAAFFTAEAGPAVVTNIDALALGALGRSLERVDPTRQEATKVSIEFESDGTTPFAVVSVTFEAKAKTKKREQAGRADVNVSHHATFWLIDEGGTYKIFAYTAELKADEVAKSAAFGVPAGGSRT